MLFWIDTLCVLSKGDFRRGAIGRMRRTYENAWNVLVLHGELERASMYCTPEECLLWIACSGWVDATFAPLLWRRSFTFYFRIERQLLAGQL